MRGDPPAQDLVLDGHKMSTPHARGSIRETIQEMLKRMVYPACAGIHPAHQYLLVCGSSLPRMRGDPPKWEFLYSKSDSSTPHARGSTSRRRDSVRVCTVYPACAGIHPSATLSGSRRMSLPRMRGDPPHPSAFFLRTGVSTPHARGSTQPDKSDRSFSSVCPHARGSTPDCHAKGQRQPVYPACAGIHLYIVAPRPSGIGLPRMRGDPPRSLGPLQASHKSTPHARGSTREPRA